MKVLVTEKIPIKIWDDSESIYSDYAVLQQAKNLANHPLSHKWVCLMPDFHLGYGMPIGGVLATRGGVVPNAVGVDIGCGMIAVKTNLEAAQLSREKLQEIRLAIHRRVPVGQSQHKEPKDVKKNRYLIDLYGDGGFYEPLDKLWWDQKAAYQLGTLGGGNHFIEIQKDADDQVWIMLHSGSRNLGLQVCNHYHSKAKKFMEDFKSQVPDMDLAFLPSSTDEYQQYMECMNWCMKFAEFNRLTMLEETYAAFEECGFEIEPQQFIDTHHNFAVMENHFGENLLVHRKGAVKAKGLVTIPGSMGTASYIGEGLDPTESFCTCSHGAGRVLSRKAASAAVTHDQALEMMEHVVFGTKHGSYDEHPHAYKDVDAVMANQADLVKPVHRLLPMAVVKG